MAIWHYYPAGVNDPGSCTSNINGNASMALHSCVSSPLPGYSNAHTLLSIADSLDPTTLFNVTANYSLVQGRDLAINNRGATRHPRSFLYWRVSPLEDRPPRAMPRIRSLLTTLLPPAQIQKIRFLMSLPSWAATLIPLFWNTNYSRSV